MLGFCLLLVITSCEEEQQTQIPANVLSQAKMESILLEIHEAESKLQQTGLRQDSAVALFEYYLKQIYSKHKVDSGKVNRSLRFYTQHIELMDSIYQNLEARKEPGLKK